MAEERAQRRLAAILAADVVGYSRLIERDEAGTLAALKSRRKDILQPLLAKHRGRIVKLMGDGVLVEFASAVNAVECAAELQDSMAAANGDLPQESRILVRVGITSAMSWSRAAIFTATASISPPVSKAWPIPVAYSCRRPFSTMCAAK
jgi:class 3 adenylate cyclase